MKRRRHSDQSLKRTPETPSTLVEDGPDIEFGDRDEEDDHSVLVSDLMDQLLSKATSRRRSRPKQLTMDHELIDVALMDLKDKLCLQSTEVLRDISMKLFTARHAKECFEDMEAANIISSAWKKDFEALLLE